MDRNEIWEQEVNSLLSWYDRNKRELPWRENITPYSVWVSEIMLQQTRVEAVKPYYYRFLSELPDIHALANAPEDQLLKLWEGLGYYSRVRNLQIAARQIEEEFHGEFPNTQKEILSLKGIGSYTAGAVGSICFQNKEPAVDGNVLRIYERLLGVYEEISLATTKKMVEEDLRKIMPESRPGDFNQAMMELGATVCIPNGEPKCSECPWKAYCYAHLNQAWKELPVKKKKPKRRIEKKTVMLLRCQDRIGIRKRNEKGLLAGLWEFPNVEGQLTLKKVKDYLEKEGYEIERIEKLPSGKHIFSHVEWQMNGYSVEVAEYPRENDILYVEWQDYVERYAIPAAFDIYKKWLSENKNKI